MLYVFMISTNFFTKKTIQRKFLGLLILDENFEGFVLSFGFSLDELLDSSGIWFGFDPIRKKFSMLLSRPGRFSIKIWDFCSGSSGEIGLGCLRIE